jgi:DNA-binding winged helix-turn-helix (wHTH) protein
VELTLTPREFALAKILFAGVGRVVPLSSLSARVWGVSVELSKRTLEQHVYKLRRKLKECFREDVRIQAAYGIGYRLDLIVSVPPTVARSEAATQSKSTGGWTGIERRRSRVDESA